MDLETYEKLQELIRTLNAPKDWVTEVVLLEELTDKLKKSGKDTTVRAMAKILNKAKSWIHVSSQLARGLKTYPDLKKLTNRHEAYQYLMKKNKLRRFLES